jgi:hypothetical protein
VDGGGGASGGTLNYSTLTGNSAQLGGGAIGKPFFTCTLTNCIVYFNNANEGPNYAFITVLNYSCTPPLPESWQQGVGNIASAPLFVDYAGGNLRLQSNSPCIKAGLNAYAPGPRASV